MNRLILLLILLNAGTAFAQETIRVNSAESIYTSGVDMMDRSNFGSARLYFERYLATNDTIRLQDAKYYQAICALKLYNLDGEYLINNFIANYPTAVQAQVAYYELGQYFFQDRDYKKSIQYFEQVDLKALTAEQKIEAKYKTAYSYFARKQFSKALGPFNSLKSSNNKYTAISHYYAGYIEFEQEDYEAALDDYLAIKDNKTYAASVPYMVASVYYKQDKFSELITYAEPIILGTQKVSQLSKMTLLVAESYYAQEAYAEAAAYYDVIYGKLKFSTEAVYKYGYSLRQLGKFEQAIDILKTIADQKSASGVLASYALGELYILENNKAFALTAFKQVAQSDEPELAKEAQFAAGKLAFELDRTTECIKVLGDFVETYPNDPHVGEATQIMSKAFLVTSDYKLAVEYIEGMTTRNRAVNETYQIATFHYGVEFYNKRSFKKAVELFNKSIENNLNAEYTAKAHYWIGEAFSVGRRFADAQPHYEFVVQSEFADKNLKLEAAYGFGYCLYNTADYDKALVQFRNYVQGGSRRRSKTGDALVRLADCYYVTKDYNAAIKNYNSAINGLVKEKDYAYFQSGVVYGILSQYDQAFNNLNRVLELYKTSPYYDDAIFEKAQLQMEISSYEAAISTFSKLISEQPKSRYAPYSYERRAVAYFNTQSYPRMASDYQTIVEKYPRYPNINNALIGLQEALTLTNQSSDFDQILADFKATNPDATGLEKVEYETLKSLYNNELYDKAVVGLVDFLEQYPEDVRTFEARYLLARSYYRQGDNNKALEQFIKVLSENQITQMPRALERVADIYFEQRNFIQANNYFNQLKVESASKNQEHRSWAGLMKGHYELSNYDSAAYYAGQLLETDGTRSEFVVMATLYKGRAAFAKGMYEEATAAFTRTTEIAQDANGAEAQYYLGQLLYNQGLNAESNEALYKVPERYAGYAEWLDMAFLLVADNFIAMEEYFQAKATLESIIANSESELTVSKATSRMEALLKLEEDSRKFVPDSTNNFVEIDTVGNDK